MTAPAVGLALLVVDDEPLVAREVSRGLTRAGLTVFTAGSAAEAKALVEGRPDIGAVISDIRMPGQDGLHLASWLLAVRAGALAAEVVLITGHAAAEERELAQRCGAFAVIEKPFRLAELRSMAQAALARAAARRAAVEEG